MPSGSKSTLAPSPTVLGSSLAPTFAPMDRWQPTMGTVFDGGSGGGKGPSGPPPKGKGRGKDKSTSEKGKSSWSAWDPQRARSAGYGSHYWTDRSWAPSGAQKGKDSKPGKWTQKPQKGKGQYWEYEEYDVFAQQGQEEEPESSPSGEPPAFSTDPDDWGVTATRTPALRGSAGASVAARQGAVFKASAEVTAKAKPQSKARNVKGVATDPEKPKDENVQFDIIYFWLCLL